MSAERTEKATPKRREDARRKGQIARGAELPAALGFLAALITLNALHETFFKSAGNFLAATMRTAASNEPLTIPSVHNLILEGGKVVALLTLPIVAAAFAAGLTGNFAQGGLSFSTEALKPKGNRFNPAQNIKKIFGSDNAVNLVKTFVKLALLGSASYNILVPIIADAPTFINAPVSTVAVKLGTAFYTLGLRCGLILLTLALADYGWSWYKNEKSMRMTKQEIRDEFKDQEGDPHIKNQRRRAARALTQKRSLAEVPTATVIITNPTHFAVALRYNREKDAAPIVVAKGADEMARKIREIAGSHDIPLFENPPLARALYKAVEPNQIIPIELFSAVAEVLAFVFRQRN